MQNIINLYKEISNKSYSTLAGAIAFFLIINGGSVLCLIINICNNLGYDIFNYIDISYLPKQVSTIVDLMYKDTIKRNYSFFFSITAIISGSTLFFHIIKTSEIIYDYKKSKINLLNRVFSVFIIISFIILIITIFISFLILNYITKGSILNIFLKYITMLIIPFLLITFIIKTITPRNNKFTEVLPGILFSTIFWFVITFLFSIYLNIFLNFKIAYGVLSFFIVFMVWIYLLSQGLIIGFIINCNNIFKRNT